jgi:hypothetical protein
MRVYFATGAALLLLAAATPSLADDQPMQKASTKTMGDEGKLPPTETVGNKVPEMGATEPMTNTGSHTMGDTGTLPATKATGGEVQQQTSPPK